MTLPTIILQAAGSGGWSTILFMWIPIIAIFWFFMIRPQMKRHKEHLAMVNAVSRGDMVTTAGGIVGKVTRVQDTIVDVEIASGVTVQVIKQTLSAVEPKNKATPNPVQK